MISLRFNHKVTTFPSGLTLQYPQSPCRRRRVLFSWDSWNLRRASWPEWSVLRPGIRFEKLDSTITSVISSDTGQGNDVPRTERALGLSEEPKNKKEPERVPQGYGDRGTGGGFTVARGRNMPRMHGREPAAASQTLQESGMFLGRTVISNPGLHSSRRCHGPARERAVRLPVLQTAQAHLCDRPPLCLSRCGRSGQARVSSLAGSFAASTISIRSDTRMKRRK